MKLINIDPKALEHACQCAGRAVHHFDRMALDLPLRASIIAHARAIEQHEAFKQEVSDAVEGYAGMVGLDPKRYFARFILPKPDPLVEAIQAADEAHPGWESASDYAQHLRAALAARGLEVRKIGEGE